MTAYIYICIYSTQVLPSRCSHFRVVEPELRNPLFRSLMVLEVVKYKFRIATQAMSILDFEREQSSLSLLIQTSAQQGVVLRSARWFIYRYIHTYLYAYVHKNIYIYMHIHWCFSVRHI